MKKLFDAVFSIIVIFVLGLISVAFAHEETKEARMGNISGQIMIKGNGPMAGGTAFFFNEASGPPPSMTKYWRIPDEGFPTDNNGRFTAELREGNYYMGAFKRLSGEASIGPPRAGDAFFISQDDKGKPKLHTVKKGAVVDMGIVEARPFDPAAISKEGITSIEGTVVDANGKPMEGVLVFAFATQSMVGRPLYVSTRTAKDGKYLLRVAEGGMYYLKTRENYGGGPPDPGEVIGTFGETGAVSVKTGENVIGIDIKAAKFLGRGLKGPVPGKE